MPAVEGISVCREEGHKWPASSNLHLFRDPEGGILFDVGCGKEESFSNLTAFLAREGLRLSDIHTIVLSHAHPDHMGAMRFVEAEHAPRVLISAVEKPLAEEPYRLNRTFDIRLAPHFFGQEAIDELGLRDFDINDYFAGMCPMSSARVSGVIGEGETLRLGGHDYEALITPGHAPGHVALWRSSDGVLLTSDLVGEITAWYSPTSGGASGFLASLDRIEALDTRVILPAHGAAITDPRAAVERTRRQVLKVEERIRHALAEGPLRVAEVCERLYRNPVIRFFPGIQIISSHLERMAADGRIIREGEGFEQVVRLAAASNP